MNKQTIKTVKVSATGVQFGNAWFSHEKITGYSADQLNAGTCHVTGGAYMAWLSAEEPADSIEGCYEHTLKAMEGENDRLRAVIAYDEAKEPAVCRAHWEKNPDCLFSDMWIGWKACAQSRARSAE